MTEEQNAILIGIREKIRQIIALYEKSKEENRTLREENNHLHQLIEEKNKDLVTIDQKYETLKLAKTLSGDTNGNEEAKLKVTKIVREIDKCIALLNK